MTTCHVRSLTSATAESSSGFAPRSRPGRQSRDLADEHAQSAASVVDPGCRREPSAARGRPPKREIRYSSASAGPPSLHSRFGDGLDGRRQIGSKPAAGDVGSADAPRALRKAPPTNEPDEPGGPVLGERTLHFLAGKQETAARRLVLVVLVPAITSGHMNGPSSGPGTAANPIASASVGVYSSAAGAVSSTRLRSVA